MEISETRKRTFIDNTLAGRYQTDSGGQQPDQRNSIRQLLRVIDRENTNSPYARELLWTLLQPGHDARKVRDLLTREDHTVIALLLVRHAGTDPRLCAAAAIADHLWTRLAQSSHDLERYGLVNPQPTLL